MRADFAADAVLERRDDLAARRIVFGVGGKDQQQIERQADRVALNLHVAFLHDVEQSHLDLAGQIGQLVDGEDAAIGARQQAVVNREFVGDILSAARRLDRVDIADHVGDRHVRRRQFLHVAVVAVQPGDRRVAGFSLHQIAAAPADGRVRVVVNLAARDVRRPLVEQRGELADEAGLRLAAQSEKNKIVARQDGVDHLRHHGIFVSDDSGKERLPALNSTDQILA